MEYASMSIVALLLAIACCFSVAIGVIFAIQDRRQRMRIIELESVVTDLAGCLFQHWQHEDAEVYVAIENRRRDAERVLAFGSMPPLTAHESHKRRWHQWDKAGRPAETPADVMRKELAAW